MPSIINDTQVIDLRYTSPEPSTQQQQQKRPRTQKPVDDGGPLKPFFEEDWVKDLLATSKGAREPSPPEVAHGSRPTAREPQPQPQQPPASQAATRSSVNGHTAAAAAAQVKPGTAKQGSGSSSSSSETRTTASGSAGRNSSSDEDVPLATSLRSLKYPSAERGTPIHKAQVNMIKALREFQAACRAEVESVKAKLAERDAVIEMHRAELLKRSDK